MMFGDIPRLARCLLPALFSLWMAAPSVAAEPAKLYVSTAGNDAWSGRLPQANAEKIDGPLASIEGARDALRRLNASGRLTHGATVEIAGGNYQLKQTFVLTPADSGTPAAGIVYSAAAGQRPVLSGGRPITGWRAGKDGLLEVVLPEVKAGGWAFNQLFVGGQRRTRARTPNEGYLRTAGPLVEYKREKDRSKIGAETRSGFKFRPGDIAANWRNLGDVNIYLYHSWTNSLHWIDRVEDGAVRFTNPTGWPVGWWEREQRYYVDNVREALDAPGEWYLDRRSGLLEYYPLPGETADNLRAVAPALAQLVRIEGDWQGEKTVHDVVFRGLAFEHADWGFEDKRQNVDGQSAHFVGAAFQADGAERVVLEDCRIAHVGTYGVFFQTGCKHNRIQRCEITDLGAGGVRLGETVRQRTKAKDDKEKGAAVPALTFEGTGPRDTGHNTVDNNFIHDGGHVFAAGTGVFLGHTGFNRLTHNEVCDFRYSGFCLGWVWGYGKSVAHHNTVADNHIHHLGWGVLSDMGGVYTLGPSPGTVVAHNLIHHVNSYDYGGWGLYTDEGSSEIVLENNVCYDTKTGGFHQHYGRDNVIRNNILAFSRELQVQRSREDLKNSIVFERNLVYCDNDRVSGRVFRNGDYRLDYNVYWSTAEEPLFDSRPWEQWRAESGQDAHSLLADPKFVDPHKRDFRLQPDSPAAKVGFKPIEMSGWGLYGDPAWTARPKAVKRAEFVLPPTAAPMPRGVADDFESTPAGSRPAGAQVLGEEGGASIRVSAEAAAAGKQSLKFSDAPATSHSWHPYMHYKLLARKGVYRETFAVRWSAPMQLRHEWRDGQKKYLVGPVLDISPAGDLTSGKKSLARLPAERWVKIEITCGLGKEATGTFDVAVELPGQPPQRFEKLPCGASEFKQLEWFGFIAGSKSPAAAYIDELKLGPAGQ